MKGYLVVIPGSPALVRELAPADDAGARLLDAARRVLAEVLADAPDIDVELVGSRAPQWRTRREGSLAAWGAPHVDVGTGQYLPELIQRYVLAEQARRVTSVRDDLRGLNPGAVTVVSVDGSAGLTTRAPLALVDEAAEADSWCRAVLSGDGPPDTAPADGAAAWLSARGVLEPDLWVQLAGLTPSRAELTLADASLGVGRYVAVWEM